MSKFVESTKSEDVWWIFCTEKHQLNNNLLFKLDVLDCFFFCAAVCKHSYSRIHKNHKVFVLIIWDDSFPFLFCFCSTIASSVTIQRNDVGWGDFASLCSLCLSPPVWPPRPPRTHAEETSTWFWRLCVLVWSACRFIFLYKAVHTCLRTLSLWHLCGRRVLRSKPHFSDMSDVLWKKKKRWSGPLTPLCHQR